MAKDFVYRDQIYLSLVKLLLHCLKPVRLDDGYYKLHIFSLVYSRMV
jgi:hypothetical protein